MAEASGAHRDRIEWVLNIEQDLVGYVKTTTSLKRRRPIFRVPSRLRELRREQFVPRNLFVGLYQRSCCDHNDRKSKGSIFKLAVVGAFLADWGKSLNDWGNISARIVKDPKAMLEKYDEDGLDDFSTEDVQSVLSMDAILLAWFCSRCWWNAALRDRFPSVFHVLSGDDAFDAEIILDILKLENQIPLELIQNALLLFFEICNENHGSKRLESTDSSLDTRDARTQADELLQHILGFVAVSRDSALPGSSPLASDSLEPLTWGSKHFLHCVYLRLMREPSDQTELPTYVVPDSFCGRLHSALQCCFNRRYNESEIKSGNSSGSQSHLTGAHKDSAPHRFFGFAQRVLKYCFNWRKHPSANAAEQPATEIAPLVSASQLRKAGISFRGKRGLEAKFEKHLLGATLYLPRILYIGDNSEAMWSNLLAFENQYEREHPFLAYVDFMDGLIDLEDDVALLRSGRNPVFDNVGVGSNAEVARIFNCLTTGYFDQRSSNWYSVRRQVMDYYNNKTRQTWVEFRRTNFGKPWLFASFLAAVALLVLTFLQTLFAILAYKYTF